MKRAIAFLIAHGIDPRVLHDPRAASTIARCTENQMLAALKLMVEGGMREFAGLGVKRGRGCELLTFRGRRTAGVAIRAVIALPDGDGAPVGPTLVARHEKRTLSGNRPKRQGGKRGRRSRSGRAGGPQ